MHAPIPLRLRGYQGEESVHTTGLRAFAAELERLVPGAFAIDLIPDATASGQAATDMFKAVETGAIEIGYMASGYLSARIGSLAVLDLPFFFRDHAHAFGLLDGAAGKIMARDIAAGSGFRLLGTWDNGYRHISSRRNHILAPGDGGGQTVRTLDNPVYRQTMEALGLTPVTYDVRDLKAAVAEGRVDAQENPLTNCHLFDVAPHQPFITLTGQILGIVLLVAAGDWFDALPEDHRAALQAAAAHAAGVQRRTAREEEVRVAGLLTAKGATIAGPEQIDIAAMAEACAGIREAVLKELDPAITQALRA